MHILITGASGFIGNYACFYLNYFGYKVTAFSRYKINLPSGINQINSKSLLSAFSKSKSLKGIDCVLHLAGKVSTLDDNKKDDINIYRTINVFETLDFAQKCSEASIPRFVYISSIKVNGEFNIDNKPFKESDKPNPIDSYAFSKYETEEGLKNLAKKSKMEVVIVRPPIIYGPNVKGYFNTILKIIKLGIPLPFAYFTKNKRSFISLENFLSFMEIVFKHPKAANNIFICSDDYDISTNELLKILIKGMNKRNRLFYLSPIILRTLFFIIGKSNIYLKLSQNLSVDCSKAKEILGWQPVITLPKAMNKLSRNYLLNASRNNINYYDFFNL